MINSTLIDEALSKSDKKELDLLATHHSPEALQKILTTKWVLHNANLKNSRLYLVGLMLFFGTYLKKDIPLALSFLRLAASRMDRAAINALGIIYKENLHGDPHAPHLKIAKILLADGAALKDSLAILHLIMMHQKHGSIAITDEDIQESVQYTGFEIKTFKSYIANQELTPMEADSVRDLHDLTLDTLVYDPKSSLLSTMKEDAFKDLEMRAREKAASDLFNLGLAYEHGLAPLDKPVEVDLKKKNACAKYLAAFMANPHYSLAKEYADRLLEEHKQSAGTSKNASPIKLAVPVKSNARRHKYLVTDSPETSTDDNATDANTKAQAQVTPPLQQVSLRQEQSLEISESLSPHFSGPHPLTHKRKRDFPAEESNAKVFLQTANEPPTPAQPPEQVIRTKLREFIPAIEPRNMDYQSIQFFKKERQRRDSPAASKQSPRKSNIEHNEEKSSQTEIEQTSFSEEALKKIGRWGEEHVFHLLQKYYQTVYPNHVFTLTTRGFALTDASNNKNKIEIIWYNKDAESYKSKDFGVEITINGAITEKQRLEVKTTTAHAEHYATISNGEFQKIIRYQQKSKPYSIFRVYGAGNPQHVKVEVIDNILERITAGEFPLSLNIKF
ncbi:SEL1-like repeat protein [Legionella septentrionalis]|uniref:SEL1-like repeat protein n=1 Tax=Legionella septentrionalis TaxID=2498109 RepID=UPI000F8E8FCF|nr:SEL1-like repeat protein [Legionella septentrionalis]RUR15001.1 DUF3883 domain-containing protein [Legionella septentrionalis]